ncbi:hypothetical protein [Roseinatronobacter alkalisoli]|uniref:Uncharacterized protein n=1 Tax=Roseinatronobacter alkalisoli TaxID=3028235 RepID=A0ABT5T8D9_9RHOB|nr:hypothetical protein [Roseinatronobacter sp. HJB301]MDD7971224.1 hypothetical protein [Roseinatronobacter sp. HJB301]
MASITTNIHIGGSAFGKRLLAFLTHLATLSPTYKRITFYNSKSDEELAEMGMSRSDVPAKVFGARLYL